MDVMSLTCHLLAGPLQNGAIRAFTAVSFVHLAVVELDQSLERELVLWGPGAASIPATMTTLFMGSLCQLEVVKETAWLIPTEQVIPARLVFESLLPGECSLEDVRHNVFILCAHAQMSIILSLSQTPLPQAF